MYRSNTGLIPVARLASCHSFVLLVVIVVIDGVLETTIVPKPKAFCSFSLAFHIHVAGIRLANLIIRCAEAVDLVLFFVFVSDSQVPFLFGFVAISLVVAEVTISVDSLVLIRLGKGVVKAVVKLAVEPIRSVLEVPSKAIPANVMVIAPS